MSGIQFSAPSGAHPDHLRDSIAMQGAAAIVAATAKAKTIPADPDQMCALVKAIKKALME